MRDQGMTQGGKRKRGSKKTRGVMGQGETERGRTTRNETRRRRRRRKMSSDYFRFYTIAELDVNPMRSHAAPMRDDVL